MPDEKTPRLVLAAMRRYEVRKRRFVWEYGGGRADLDFNFHTPKVINSRIIIQQLFIILLLGFKIS